MTPARASFALILLAAAVGAVIGAGRALRPGPEAPPAAAAQAPAAPIQPQAATPGTHWFDAAMLGASPAARARPAAAPAFAIYGRNGRPIDFGGKDAYDYIDARAAAARTGDLRAAYQVYQAASACAASEEPLPDFLDPAEGQAAARERARVRALCARVSPAQLQERMRFLARAADAGDRKAEVDFFMEGPGGKPLAGADPADPEVQQWRQQALGYLKQAGAQCDPYALGLLSNAYDAGQLGAQDAGMTMAYAIAAAAARRHPLSDQQLRNLFGETLAPADFDAARRQGERIAAASCPPSAS